MADFDFPNIGFQKMTMRLRSATAISTSPFTFDQQTYEHQGVRWEAEITLPPLKRSEAKAAEAFFAQLRGQAKTFTLGNPLHNVAGASGFITSGAQGATNVTGTVSSHVEVGDYFEVGGALYILTAENASTLDIMPPLRTAISSSTALDFTLPKGEWRLASNDIDWNINRAGIYGFTFACVEAI
jgi:hypothetical protein